MSIKKSAKKVDESVLKSYAARLEIRVKELEVLLAATEKDRAHLLKDNERLCLEIDALRVGEE